MLSSTAVLPLSGVGQEPVRPPRLTEGIPDPAGIERQKTAFARGIQEQLDQGIAALNEQLKQQTEFLHAIGDQKKRQLILEVDKDIKQKEMCLAQQHNQQVLLLQRAAQQQRAALEHQSTSLTLEYNERRAQEELQQQQYEYTLAHYQTQKKYMEEMQSLHIQGSIAEQQVATQQAQIAQQVTNAQQQATAAAHQVLQSSSILTQNAARTPPHVSVSSLRAPLL